MLWSDNDFDSLPRLGELYTLAEFKENVCEGETFIDSATAESLYYYFLTRKVCSVETMQVKGGETVNFFELFFRRHLQKYSPQYLQYLRVQLTEIDPMVTQYMERLIDRVNVNSRKTERSTTDSTNGTNRQTTNTSDSRNGTQNVTENTSGDKTTGGNTSETTRNTRTGGTTENTTNSRTKTFDNTTTEAGTEKENNRSMHAELPQSATGAGDGLPGALNWRYATNQDESERNATDSNTTKQNGTEKDNDTGTRTTSNNESDNGTRTGQTSGTEHTTGKRTGDQTTTERGQSDTVTEGTTGTTSKGQGTEQVSGNDNGTTKERYAGRTEAPQRLLDAARDYITKTNAWKWFVEMMDDCFMNWYEI